MKGIQIKPQKLVSLKLSHWYLAEGSLQAAVAASLSDCRQDTAWQHSGHMVRHTIILTYVCSIPWYIYMALVLWCKVKGLPVTCKQTRRRGRGIILLINTLDFR